MQVSNISFGKTPILKCRVKNSNSNSDVSATLYKMDPKDSNDDKDIKYSKTAYALYPDFKRSIKNPVPIQHFYLLQNDKTNEVISGVEISHRYRVDSLPFEGSAIQIDEMVVNQNYENAPEPILGFLSKMASNRHDNSIISAVSPEDINTDLSKYNFEMSDKTGEWALLKDNFGQEITYSNMRYNVEYLV